jgi:hypothetical protein
MKKLTSIILAIMFLASLGAAYAADGDIIWSKIYPANDHWQSYGVAVDSQNNAIVTGYSGTNYLLIKYDSNGDLLWPAALIGPVGTPYSVAVDSQNNIIVTGYSGSNYLTTKYDPNGNPLWSAPVIGPAGIAYDVAIDSQNNILVTGASGTVKYSPAGNSIWSDTYPGTAYSVAIDAQNNIIVTGISSNDFYTVKYDPSGNILWQKTYDSGNTDYSPGVAIDSLNNVIISGYATDPVNGYASVAVKYSSSGAKLWDVIDNTGGRWSYNVAVDSYNNIFVTGGEYDSYGYYQYLTVKYDPSGKKVWERLYDFSDYYDDSYDIAMDSYNNIIVTGYVYNNSQYDYFTIKYQGVPPRSKSLPIAQILKILKLNKEK